MFLIPSSTHGHVCDSSVFFFLSLVSFEVPGSCGVSAPLQRTMALGDGSCALAGNCVLATKKSYRKKKKKNMILFR